MSVDMALTDLGAEPRAITTGRCYLPLLAIFLVRMHGIVITESAAS